MSISAALGLLQFVPKLAGLFDLGGKGNKVSQIAETVAKVALAVTGKPTVSEARDALAQDPSLALEFEIACMDKNIHRTRVSSELCLQHQRSNILAFLLVEQFVPSFALLATRRDESPILLLGETWITFGLHPAIPIAQIPPRQS